MRAPLFKELSIYCAVALLLPGCGRIIDWGKKSFVQVPVRELDPTIQRMYIRSATAYDQVATRGKFDVLWLSDDVRTMFSQLLATKFGRTEEQKKAFLRRQLEENKHFIAFYVLSLHEHPLGDPTSDWTVFLSIDGKNYAPIEIKSVDLPPEYIFIFGKKYTRFRVPYSVKFDARTIEDLPLIDDTTQSISLYFRSVDKELVMTWDLHPVLMVPLADVVAQGFQKDEEQTDEAAR